MYMFRRVVKANDERNDQMAILVSMSDIYNSMHLIDLETNTFTEYHARAEVSKVVKSSDGADETMKQLMIMTTERKYCESALAFTDIHSIADRMKNKKILSKEFMSKAIGWYRGSFITIEADLEGRPTKLVYVTQNIDKEKKKEEELLYKSHMDELTGLHNRRAYEDSIAEHSRIPTEENFVFVSLDVNGLKTVNDTKGHAAGDELLIGAATCMKRCFGPYGRVYRVGGDEFAAIIFANQRQLEHIKKDFAETTGQWSGDLVKSISVSSGYVTKQEAGEATVHEIAEMADKKMYEAKARYYEKHDRRAHR
jgi:diguanylate cyclase (GGDEF)-like protein